MPPRSCHLGSWPVIVRPSTTVPNLLAEVIFWRMLNRRYLIGGQWHWRTIHRSIYIYIYIYSTRHWYWRQCILKVRVLASNCHKLEVSNCFSSKDMNFYNISVPHDHCHLNIAQWASQRKFEKQGVFLPLIILVLKLTTVFYFILKMILLTSASKCT